MVNTLLVDNYDSFTYNLYALLTEINGTPPRVVPNDARWEEIDFTRFDNVVISPGPGTPECHDDFGLSSRVFRDSGLPVLGVCLGHQGLCSLFGARVDRAPEAVHGRLSLIEHTQCDLFANLPSPMKVVRYHSLAVTDLPDVLEPLAWTHDGVLMAVRHRQLPLWGVQFHPESICSQYGRELLTNFRDQTLAGNPHTAPPLSTASSPTELSTDGDAERRNSYHLRYIEVDRDIGPELLYSELFENNSGSFWLDRSAQTDSTSRFTIMGDCTGPLGEYVTYDVKQSMVTVQRAGRPDEIRYVSFFDYLENELRSRAIPVDPDLPFDFALGYVGYLGYELKAETGGELAHRSPHPDAALVFADRAVVIDHNLGRCYVLCLSQKGDIPASLSWLARTSERIAALEEISETVNAPTAVARPAELDLTLRHTGSEYRALIGSCQDLINVGETYEVCLTNTAVADATVDAGRVFSHLRRIDPAPYAALLKFDDLAVISASPERFLRVRMDRTVESKPIKGTRPRGDTALADRQISRDLVASEKDRAENLMIVDLVRNDLTRVCLPESVHVPTLFGVETFATVHQLVSTVRGTLRADAHVVDLVRATFPAGSITGAPKVRTMQILDRLEGGARGIYSGALGYFSLSGTADLSVIIRTIVATSNTVEYGIGGAVTALSDPEDEFAETLVKAAAMQHVLEGRNVRAQVDTEDNLPVAEPLPARRPASV